MEHFIRFFKISSEDALHLRLSSVISPSWTCSHRSRECLIKGTCLRENFVSVCSRVLMEQDYGDVQLIIKISKSMMTVRGDLWCNVLNHAKKHVPDHELERNEVLSALSDTYSHSTFQEEIASLKRFEEKATPVYTDDSVSLIYTFFMLVSTDSETTITDVRRLGRFLIAFYSVETFKTNLIWQNSSEARPFVSEVLNWGLRACNECIFTGSKRSAQGVVWLPDTVMNVFNNPNDVGLLLRVLDADLKTILSFDSKDPTRLCFQRFAIKGFSISSLYEIFNLKIENRNLFDLILNRKINTLSKLFMPMLLIRGYFYNYYSASEMRNWFITDLDCQSCYVQANCSLKQIMVLDSRAAEILGRQPERAGRLIKHQDGDLRDISSFELRHGEMLSRQGNHWIAFNCLDSNDALLVTITLIHRYLRGSGLESSFDIQVAMNALARCYLYWGPIDTKIVSAIFHIMCYLLLKKKLEVQGGNLPWYDLGTFINIVTKPERLHLLLVEKMHAAVAKASIYYLRLAVHGFGITKGHISENNIRKLIRIPKVTKSIVPRGIIKR
ncbi:NS1 [Peruvian horse sickness virus]|uniref:Non-structural protein NS1 n=1 Tax=Peruvian horse sickness virus TaxID=356862 RepID=Q2Q1D7_9REOV|nr:NS1 [Peruvian horse sickness virus]ABB72777.1 NS1 [Peruvian horse sickness virus]